MKFELKSVKYYQEKLKTAKNKWIRQMWREKLKEAKKLIEKPEFNYLEKETKKLNKEIKSICENTDIKGFSGKELLNNK